MKLDKDERAAPVDVRLTAEATRAFVGFVNRHGEEKAGLTGADAAAWSKLEGYASRFALVLHLARWADCDPTLESSDAVDGASMDSGISLADWFGHTCACENI